MDYLEVARSNPVDLLMVLQDQGQVIMDLDLEANRGRQFTTIVPKVKVLELLSDLSDLFLSPSPNMAQVMPSRCYLHQISPLDDPR